MRHVSRMKVVSYVLLFQRCMIAVSCWASIPQHARISPKQTLNSSSSQRVRTPFLYASRHTPENQLQGPTRTLRRRQCLAFIINIVSSISTANALEPTMSNTPSFLTSLSAQEEAELLNSFGKGLSSSSPSSSPENNSSTNSSAWPNAPSPLPTISRTAAEVGWFIHSTKTATTRGGGGT